MLYRLFARAMASSPNISRRVWQGWYDLISARYLAADWTFMNYGYAELDPAVPPFPLRPRDEPNRCFIQLYQHVAGAVPLEGKNVVEVGSGRGGGCSYMARNLGPSKMTGVDCSEKAVTFCKNIHNHPALTFKAGDCESLPFEAGEVDAVVNVESSHCYPSMPGFLGEVMRVLKPGGHLLWADIRAKETSSEMYRLFENAGFDVLRDSVITPNVLAALDEVTERKQEIIDEKVPKLFRPIASDFAGLKGTKVYERFQSGEMSYYSFTLRKPE